MRVVDFSRFAFLCRRGDDASGKQCGAAGSAPALPNSLYLQRHSGSSPIKARRHDRSGEPHIQQPLRGFSGRQRDLCADKRR